MNIKQHLAKKELLVRNQAYKLTLEYCSETCDNIDQLYINTFIDISKALDLSDTDRKILVDKLNQLNNDVKDKGTRKLRQAFVDYVLKHNK